MLTDLSDPEKGQPRLLDMLNGNAARDARRRKLLEVVDRINRVQGRGTLRFAAQGAKDARWHMAPAVATKEATDGDSNRLPRKAVNATTVAIRMARRLADGWRKRANLSLAWTTDSGGLLRVGGVRGVYRATPDGR